MTRYIIYYDNTSRNKNNDEKLFITKVIVPMIISCYDSKTKKLRKKKARIHLMTNYITSALDEFDFKSISSSKYTTTKSVVKYYNRKLFGKTEWKKILQTYSPSTLMDVSKLHGKEHTDKLVNNCFNPQTPLLVPDFYLDRNCGENILPANITSINDKAQKKERMREFYKHKRCTTDKKKFSKGNCHYVNGAITTKDAIDEDVYVVDTKCHDTSIDINLSISSEKSTNIFVKHIDMQKHSTIMKYMHIVRKLFSCTFIIHLILYYFPMKILTTLFQILYVS